ncbi:ribonuclease M5 [Bacillus sp. SORGH_AS 510]|nr:ribonuclease M5 [Bacillus sp. SORGH_AS_0510]
MFQIFFNFSYFITKELACIMKIKEIIVVEGKDDTTAIKRAVDADTIETNGSAVNQATIEKVRRAQETRGVIIFTDPDFPGEKIRKTIAESVPGCKHAFLTKAEAIAKGGRGLGVEHASPEAIREALKDAQILKDIPSEVITQEDLITAGLIGGDGAKERRILLGEILKIGYTNGKQLHKRLMMFQISKQEFAEALSVVLHREEENE